MKPCLASRARNLGVVLFFLFCYSHCRRHCHSQCKIETTVGLLRKYEEATLTKINKTN